MRHVVPLSDGDARHAKNVVGRDEMKVEVWHQEVMDVGVTWQL